MVDEYLEFHECIVMQEHQVIKDEKGIHTGFFWGSIGRSLDRENILFVTPNNPESSLIIKLINAHTEEQQTHFDNLNKISNL